MEHVISMGSWAGADNEEKCPTKLLADLRRYPWSMRSTEYKGQKFGFEALEALAATFACVTYGHAWLCIIKVPATLE